MSELKALSVKGNIPVDKDGNLLMVRSQASGGTQLYKHTIDLSADGDVFAAFIEIISTSNTSITSVSQLYNDFYNYIKMNLKSELILEDSWKNIVTSVKPGEESGVYLFYIDSNSTGFELKTSYELSDTVTAL